MRIAEIIQADPNFQPAEHCSVSVYRREQAYGGPEEGGWWHTVNTFIGGVNCASREAAKARIAEYEKQAEELSKAAKAERPGRYAQLGDDETVTSSQPEGDIPTGWSDGGEYFVVIENVQGERDNSQEAIPHYE